jgi:hypothetical protein
MQLDAVCKKVLLLLRLLMLLLLLLVPVRHAVRLWGVSSRSLPAFGRQRVGDSCLLLLYCLLLLHVALHDQQLRRQASGNGFRLAGCRCGCSR